MNIKTKILSILTALLIVHNLPAQKVQDFPRNLVIEENTATWCGYCVIGIYSMQKMEEEYPNRFIGISIHHEDDLNINPYKNQIGNMPGAMLNRKTTLHVDADKFREAINKHLSDKAPAKIEVNAEWVNHNKNQIAITAVATFGHYLKGNYKYAFIVVEDSIMGYQQKNFIDGGEYGSYYGLDKLPEIYYPYFSHVARFAYPDSNGKTFTSTTRPGETFTFEHIIDTPSPLEYAEPHDHTRIIALLIGPNGEIINAATTKYIRTVRVSGIEQTAATSGMQTIINNGVLTIQGVDIKKPLEIYHTNGNLYYSGPQTSILLPTGIYIIQCDGQRKKVLVK